MTRAQHRPWRRHWRRAAAFGCCSVVLGGGFLAGAPVEPAHAAAALTLVDAPLTIGAGETIPLDLRLPSAALLPARLTVSTWRLGTPTASLVTALADTTAPPTDSVELGPSAMSLVDGVLHVEVPAEKVETDAGRLSLDEAGVYAVSVTVPSLGSVTVPIIRRAEGTRAPAVPFGIAVDVDAPLSLKPDGTTLIATAGRAAMTRLVTFLETTTVPVSIAVRPELLDSLARSSKLADRELVDRLAAAIGPHRLLSVPYLHIDPSIAANAGAAEEFTAQLRLGEDALSRLLGRLPDRRVWLATDPLSPAGADLIRNLGAQALAEGSGVARDLARTTGASSDALTTVLQPVDIDDELAIAEDDPVRAAHRIAVELLLGATGGSSAQRASSATSVFLKPDLTTANLDVLGALVALLAEDDSLHAVDMVRIGTGTVQTLSESAPVVADFSTARSRRAKLAKLVAATSAIVPANDPRRVEWSIRAAVLLDTRLADDERAAYETQLRAALLGVQNNVVLLMARTVNLGDRDANIPVTLENRNDVTVSVSVRLVSPKLRVPPSSEVITLESGESTTLRIPVTARTSGRFPVTAQMLAPGTKTVVGKSTVINVRVGRLTGLGLVFTFAAGLVLLSWWVQHLRRRLRREETKELERRTLAGLPVDDFDDVVVVEPQTDRDGGKSET